MIFVYLFSSLPKWSSLMVCHIFYLVDIHKLTILDAQGCTHTLNRYYAKWDKPRPESSIMVCVVC